MAITMRSRGCSKHLQLAIALLVSMLCQPAVAMHFDWGEQLRGSFTMSASLGAAVRMESRDSKLVGKLNLPGQFNFCEDKMGGVNCSGAAGNARFLALPGTANVNRDDGDLNYDKGDLIAGVVRLVPTLKLRYRGIGLNLKAYAFYDPVNYDRDNRHPNNFSNNGFQPARTSRPGVVNRSVGADVRLKSAYVSGTIPVADYRVTVKLGEQVLNWGEALTLVLNGISTISPPDATILTMPGSEPGEFLIPEPMLDIATDLTASLSLEAFYQFGWRRARLPPSGGYFATNDILTDGGNYAAAGFGKYREDPDNRVGKAGRIQDNIALLTRSGRTLYRTKDRKPQGGGQYGLRLGYFATDLNNTSFGLYFHNLHSRFPFGSFIAAKSGCLTGTSNAVDVLLACGGFANVPGGKEPTPFDTAQYFRDYPEDMRTFGFSFSTNLGAVAWAGEIAYRPNQPLQIDSVDLGFAALQPFLPDKTISLAVVEIPGKRVAAPDYIATVYRNQSVRPQQVISGYERFKTVQYDTSFLLLRGRSANPFGADQLTVALELGAYEIIDLPPLDRLQLAAPGTFYHHSAGIDGTGAANADQSAAGVDSRLNPTYQKSGYATRWSYGYRLISKADYENLFYGVKVSPQLAFFHDVGGMSPLPTGQFVAGRKQLKLGVALSFTNQISSTLRYTWFWGGGDANLLADRDYLEWSVTYDF